MTPARPPFALLKRGCYGKAERLARFPQQEVWSISIHRQVIGVVPGSPRREHAARDRDRRSRLLIQAERIVSPIDAERCVDDRQEHLQFQPGRNARLPIGGAQHLQVLRGSGIQNIAPSAVVARIERRTTNRSTDDLVILRGRNLQLRAPNRGIDAAIDKRSDGDRAGDRDAHLQVGPHTEISAGEYDLIDWNGDSPVSLPRIGGILQNRCSVRIGERDYVRTGQKRDRRDGADIESANIVLAAHIEALERRRYQPAIPADEGCIHTVADGVPSLLHRKELLELDDRPDGTHRAAESGELRSQRHLLSAMREHAAVERVEGEVGEDLAGDDSVYSVRSGDTAERDEVKQGLRRRAQGNEGGAVQRISQAKALERASQRIAERRGEAYAR